MVTRAGLTGLESSTLRQISAVVFCRLEPPEQGDGIQARLVRGVIRACRTRLMCTAAMEDATSVQIDREAKYDGQQREVVGVPKATVIKLASK